MRPARVAAPPVITAVTPHPGSLSVTWTPVSVGPYGPVLVYELLAYDGSNLVNGVYLPADASEGTVSGLTNGTTYRIAVVAYLTSATIGSDSYPTGMPTLAAPPALPSGPAILPAATSGQGFATMAWGAPTDDGGSSIVGYGVVAVDVLTGGVVAWRNVAPDVRSASLTGLVAGRTYDLYVLPVTALGWGAPTAPLLVISPLISPVEPQGPVMSPLVSNIQPFLDPAYPQVHVIWAPAHERGAPLTNYDVVVMQQGRMRSWQAVRSDARESYVDLGAQGTAQIYVFAQTATGYGPIGNPITVEPGAPAG